MGDPIINELGLGYPMGLIGFRNPKSALSSPLSLSPEVNHCRFSLLRNPRKIKSISYFGHFPSNQTEHRKSTLSKLINFEKPMSELTITSQSAFDSAIQSQGYNSHYQGVYPVKCNHDHYVVEDIVKYRIVAAGSKPELLLAMSCLCKGSPKALLVCNGFKDAEYISLALMARKLALNTVIVLEQEEELDLVIELSKKFSVRNVIGVRAKLRTKHSGHFGEIEG